MAAPSLPAPMTTGRRPAVPGGARRWPWATATLTLLLLAATQPDLAAAWRFDRAAIAHGEGWRVYTGNLVHFGVGHLAWNLVILLVAGVWLERLRPIAARVMLLTTPAVVGVTLWWFRPELALYAGFSGVGTGLAALLALAYVQRSGAERVWGGMLLALMLIKTGLEFGGRGALFAQFDAAEVRVEPVAHVAGLAWAGLLAAVAAGWQRSQGLRRTEPRS